MASKELNRKYSDRFICALSLHLSSFFKRIQNGQYNNPENENIETLIKDKKEEFKVALKIKTLIEKKYNIIVPNIELAYIAILLNSVDEENDGKIAILVIAHGDSTASSMVNVAKNLLDCNSVYAVDMPLEVNPKDMLEVIIEKVKKIDMGKGVLLLVDMGSLCNFEPVIIERTGIKVKTIDMVSTPLVLEAARKTNIYGISLDDIYTSLKNFKGYQNQIDNISLNNKAIIAICSSGKGTAVKLKELVEDIINNLTEEKINVIPIALSNMDNEIKTILEKYDIIASIGLKKPKINVPFIPLELLISGNGEKILKEIIENKKIAVYPKKDNIVVRNLCEDNLKQFLTYLNPYKIISVLMEFVSVLETELNTQFSNSMKIKIIIHVGCAIERIVINEGLKYNEQIINVNMNIMEAINKACKVIEDTLKIIISEDEKLFIYNMLLD